MPDVDDEKQHQVTISKLLFIMSWVTVLVYVHMKLEKSKYWGWTLDFMTMFVSLKLSRLLVLFCLNFYAGSLLKFPYRYFKKWRNCVIARKISSIKKGKDNSLKYLFKKWKKCFLLNIIIWIMILWYWN